jgi:urea transport system ATP-binding protein
MLLAQEPKLCSSTSRCRHDRCRDRPDRRSCCKEIAKTHSVVVVEHDMGFVRELGVKVTVLARGLGAGRRPPSIRSANERVIEVYLGRIGKSKNRFSDAAAGRLLMHHAIDLHYGAAQALAACLGQRRDRQGHLRHGPQRRRQDLAAARHRRPQPISGGISGWDGADISALRSPRTGARGIAYVPQGREIFPLLTVKENLETGFAPAAPQGPLHPDELFDLFPVLKSMLGRRGGDLSGGQQQQLAIGRALVMRPKMLVLDEPTEGIQPSIIKDIGRAIDYLRQKGGMAIVLVEQYFDFARDLADTMFVMDRGEVVLAGPMAELDGNQVQRLIQV